MMLFVCDDGCELLKQRMAGRRRPVLFSSFMEVHSMTRFLFALIFALALAASADAGPRRGGGGCSGGSCPAPAAASVPQSDAPCGAAQHRSGGRIRAWLGARRCR
jgi:uncharacterized membrane protein